MGVVLVLVEMDADVWKCSDDVECLLKEVSEWVHV